MTKRYLVVNVLYDVNDKAKLRQPNCYRRLRDKCKNHNVVIVALLVFANFVLLFLLYLEILILQ